jgi:uncharacterized protein YkwD
VTTKPPDKTPVALSAEERKLLDLINKLRADAKAAPLKPSVRLVEAARAEAAAGKKPSLGGDDNLGFNRISRLSVARPNLTAQQVFDGWNAFDAIRLSLLENYQEIGIGMVRTQGDVISCRVILAADPN